MSEEPDENGPPSSDGRRRRVAVAALLVVATLLTFASVNALWLNRQLLDTEQWTESSSELLQRESIRIAVADFLTDEAYVHLNVEGELEAVLPTRAKPLAGPAAGALRSAFNRGTDELLQRPRVQALWEDANRIAHKDLLRILEEDDDDSAALKGGRGEVVLDLAIVLNEIAKTLGVGQGLAAKLPPDAAEITIIKSDQIEVAQDSFHAFKGLTELLLILTVVLFVAAVAAASGRRREALRGVGIGFIVAGVAALIERAILGNAIVGSLTTTATVESAAGDVWEIGTSQLVQAAEATLGYGVVIVIAAWLAGPTQIATSARRSLHLGDARIAYGGLAVLFLMVVAWGPTPATRKPLPLVLLALLLVIGMEILRRQAAAETPAGRGGGHQLLERGGAAVSGAVARVRSRGWRAADPATARIEQLERLAQLKQAGVLDDDELAREKRRILGEGDDGD